VWHIEESFRVSEHDLQARPVYHHTRESIEAHLTIVFAALAVTHWIEQQTDGASRNSCAPHAATAQFTAADPLPDDLNEGHTKIGSRLEH
jgi:hypothetical protein